MADMEILCSLIVTLLDDASEGMFEEGTLTLSFDCKGYHYECELKRTVNDAELKRTVNEGDTND